MDEKYIHKIATLTESFPYIREFYGKTIVIKYGGHAMTDVASFAMDVALLKHVGITPVIVHGGGPQIGSLIERMGGKSEFVGGMRVTDSFTMDIVEMVLAGRVNKEIVGELNRQGSLAVGLTGKDGELFVAEKILIEGKDIGQVGTVKSVNPSILQSLKERGFIPVIAPVGLGADNITYNINADIVAGKVAAALQAEKLILLTDIEGVKIKGDFRSTLTKGEAEGFIASGDITGGMIPKVNCCLDALAGGVGKAHIIDGHTQHAVLLEIFTDSGIGTEIVA